MFLMKKLPHGKDFPSGAAASLRAVAAGLTLEQAREVKETEKITNHDIKAVEYFIKKKFDEQGLEKYTEVVLVNLENCSWHFVG